VGRRKGEEKRRGEVEDRSGIRGGEGGGRDAKGWGGRGEGGGVV